MNVFFQLRTAAGLTQEEVSGVLEIPASLVAAYETGAGRPSARELQILRGLSCIARASSPSERTVSSPTMDSVEIATRGSRKAEAPASSTIQAPTQTLLRELQANGRISPNEIARRLGTSLVSVVRWTNGDQFPNSRMASRVRELHTTLLHSGVSPAENHCVTDTFASRGVSRLRTLPLFNSHIAVQLSEATFPPLSARLMDGAFWGDGRKHLASSLACYSMAAKTAEKAPSGTISAGKNTYTYDAHTYHTKVPPQGIAEVIAQYLPQGGLVLDPFAGSGMTGVAARTLGCDVILNELSPAASFIADRFTRSIDPAQFASVVASVVDSLIDLRSDLYQTRCRECSKPTEILHTVWSYRVLCSHCSHEFVLWDHCRRYGNTVREHKILSEFPCPSCGQILTKSRLRRSIAVPVLVGYKCCRKAQIEHPPTPDDIAIINRIERAPNLAQGYVPTALLPDGANLGQPKRHGLISVDRFYTPRNLSAMSHLWRTIHRIGDAELAAFVGFVFTSLYQRVTRLSEYRFWGGSGNTANYNVPYIFNEANVFVTFERKARTIQDHLETTARSYRSRCTIHTGSATNLSFLPDQSVDLIFTDPPFGANINYSEMNFLWEAWLGAFTDNSNEAIVNKFQQKDATRYGEIMQASLRECFRVLRPDHWLLLVFMNSSEKIWEELKRAITGAGFTLERIDIFDKQHGTFKQFVSDNTAGCDLILHCRKRASVDATLVDACAASCERTVVNFLRCRTGPIPRLPYLHVNRSEEIDYRLLYSEWLASALLRADTLMDFSAFRKFAARAVFDANRKIADVEDHAVNPMRPGRSE